MTQRERVWLLRLVLLVVFLYATFAGLFYGWHASFSGPNQSPATVVANIWSVVSLTSLVAIVATFFRGKTA